MTVTTSQVTTLFENVLFESPTIAAQNAANYTGFLNLNSSTSTVAGVAAYLANQPEASIAAQVIDYYQGALNRVPTAFEVNYYVQIAEAGLNASQIANGVTSVSNATWAAIASDFASSPEFQKDFGVTGGVTSSNAAAIVSGFYENILGRNASASEISYYVNELNSGVSVATLLQNFTESPEYQKNVAATVTADLSASGVSAVATVAAGGTPQSQTGPVLGTLPGVGTTTTFALTTGVDNLTGGNGTNIFVGTLDSTAGVATFGGADSITGAGISNTLLLTDAAADRSVLPVGATISDIQTITFKTAGNAGSSVGPSYFDTSGVSGVTALNVTSSGALGDYLKAAATTNITDTSLAANAVTTQGGDNVTVSTSGAVTVGGSSTTDPAGAVVVTESGASTVSVDGGTTVAVTATGLAAGDILVDTNVASTGAISITATGVTTGEIFVGNFGTPIDAASTVAITDTASLGAGATAGVIEINGGTTDTVSLTIAPNSTLAAAQAISSASAGTITGAPIFVIGGSATTSVTVNQTAAVAAAAGTAAVGATPAGTGTSASPGVAAVAGSAAVAAKALVPGTIAIVDGAVTVEDSAGTIATVTANNFASLLVEGTGTGVTALATLNVGGTGGNITLDDASSTVTTLALNTTALTGGALSDQGVITKMNITNSGTTTLAGLSGALTALTVAGAGSVAIGTFAADVNLASVAVSGSAGFSDGGTAATGLDAIAALTSITTTSSGAFSAYLKDTTQTFTGSTGADTITVDASLTATKTITAGTATNNELILDGTTSFAGASSIGSKVTGFQILGVENNAAAASTLNVATVDANASTLDVINLSNALAVSNLATGAAVSIDATTTAALTIGYVDASGIHDTTNLTLAKGITVNSLTLQDANSVGIATVNITGAGANVISALNDTNITNLSVTGGSSLSIGVLTETTNATSLAITDAESTGVTITTLTAPTLGSISFAGAGATTIVGFAPGAAVTTLGLSDTGAAAGITTLTDNTLTTVTFSGTGAITVGTLVDGAASLTLNNTGSATDTVTTFASTTLASLTLKGSVVVGDNSGLTTAGHAIQLGTVATGITVTGSTDNAHVALAITTGASAGNTDTINLGNGNDLISDASTAGTVAVSVGSGSDLIILGGTTTDTTGAYTVTALAHTGPDYFEIGTAGTAYATTPNLVVTGALTGDRLYFLGDAASSATALTATTAGSTVAATITAIEAAAHTIGAHGVAYAVFDGNTYIAESLTGTLGAADTSLVELVGTHTLTASLGHLTVAS